MKLRVVLKDPDGFYEATREAAEDMVREGRVASGRDLEDLRGEIEEGIRQWVKWGEYVTLEFDLETNSARVLPQGS